jgi:hypothetical protein
MSVSFGSLASLWARPLLAPSAEPLVSIGTLAVALVPLFQESPLLFSN